MIRTATLPLFTRLSTPRLSRMSSSVSGMQPQYSAGEDEATVQRGVEALTGAGWGLDSERMGVQKTYYFRSYFKAIVSLSFYLKATGLTKAELRQHDCGGERRQEAPRGDDGGMSGQIVPMGCWLIYSAIRISRCALDDA